MKRSKIYIIIALLGMAVLIVCFVVGALNRLDWLILLGFGICGVVFIADGAVCLINYIRRLNNELAEEAEKERTSEREAELLNEINSATDSDESKIAQAKYYGNGAKNVGELAASAFGFSEEGRKAFKEAPLREKLKPIAFYTWLGLTLLTFLAGITLSNVRVQPVGFILMGVGGGSFFLTIIGLLISSIIERSTYYSKRSEKSSKTVIRSGVVKRCELHSQHKTGNRTPRISGTLYQIWVWTSDKEPLVRLVCSRRYNKYDKVKFSEKHFIRTKRRIIEE